jgi:hypothetical protein
VAELTRSTPIQTPRIVRINSGIKTLSNWNVEDRQGDKPIVISEYDLPGRGQRPYGGSLSQLR